MILCVCQALVPDSVFVDAKARKAYKLKDHKYLHDREANNLVWTLKEIVSHHINRIDVPKGSSGFKDDKLLRIAGPVVESEDDWFAISKLYGKEMEAAEFSEKFADTTNKIVHLKGFGGHVAEVYNDTILADLNKFKVLVWDGDDLDSGFTKIIPMFLCLDSSKVVVSFKKRYEVPKVCYLLSK